jgi:hypothetical protein
VIAVINVKRELEILKASPGERATLLKQPPRGIHCRTALVLTARRWARLANAGGDLVFQVTDAGRDVLSGYGKP